MKLTVWRWTHVPDLAVFDRSFNRYLVGGIAKAKRGETPVIVKVRECVV